MKTQTTYLESKYHFFLISLLFTALLFCLPSFAQNYNQFKPTQIIVEDWDVNVWKNSARITHTYDGSNNVIGTQTYIWDADTNNWEQVGRVIYTNNPDGTASQELYQGWDEDSGTWVDISRVRHTYIAGGKLSVSVTEFWLGTSWFESSKVTNTYGGSGYLIKTVVETADFFIGALMVSSQTDYTNFANGLLNFSITQRVNPLTGMLENSERTTNTYKPNNKILTTTTEEWNGTAWVNDHRTTTSYDGNDYVIHELYEEWDLGGGIWVNNSQTLTTNNASGIPTQFLIQDWLVNNWVNSTRISLQYGALGVNDFAAENVIAVFPIPADSQVTVKANFDVQGASYVISDQAGRVYQRGRLDSEETLIDINHLATGVYFCQFGQDKNQTVKIVKR